MQPAGPRQRIRELLYEMAGPLRQQDEAISKIDGCIQIVRNEKGGDLDLLPDPLNHLHHLEVALVVQSGEGFVEEHDVGVENQAAQDADHLLLAATEAIDAGVGVQFDAEPLHHVARPVTAFGLGNPLELEGEGDILLYRSPWEKTVAVVLPDEALGHTGRAPVLGGDGARFQLFQSRDESQQRRLAATVRPENRDELALLDAERQVLDPARFAADGPVGPPHMVHPEHLGPDSEQLKIQQE